MKRELIDQGYLKNGMPYRIYRNTPTPPWGLIVAVILLVVGLWSGAIKVNVLTPKQVEQIKKKSNKRTMEAIFKLEHVGQVVSDPPSNR